jgi:hypothetical protein
MNYETEIITQEQIPSNVYFHDKNENYKYIHMYKFTNGLTFVIGSNNYLVYIGEIVNAMNNTINIVLKHSISAYELQLHYQDYLGVFCSYKDCIKIFDYYNDNEHLIRQIIKYYTEYYYEVEEVYDF